ncbi:MAG TPA: hydantoinase B/oxoprolinase family protein [Methylomirabilota bacterium]|jgi:N-methylhydantoinase B|nr:hydantoinase B/oxoprolinase family protein [Methylomirabilota bacterium]
MSAHRTIDPVLLEVLRNRLEAIADEMELTLLKSAASPIVKEGLDASAALFNIRGETIAQAAAIPIHLGALQCAAQRIVSAFPPERMRDGDAFLLNDPYDGGTHLPDITLAIPVFSEERAVALACTMCHHQDVGGRTPGSVPTDATELYQEGVIIPPTQLFRAGKLDDNLFALLARNVRLPDVFTGDLMAQVAAGRLGGIRLRELFAVHGTDDVLRYIEELMARAETLTRRQIETIPDGEYRFEDYLDNDGVELDRRVKIAVAVRVNGSRMTFDFTGTDPQVRGPFNSVPASTLSAVYYAIRAISDPSVPNNGGCFRAVEAVLPEGTIVNPRPPAPVSCRTATIKRIADTILGALVRALPHRMPAANSGTLLVMAFGGQDPRTGQPFVASELAAGGMGARPGKDGIDVIETDVSNCMNIPVESVEMSFPLRIPRAGLWTDSGGAGQFRGGLGLVKVFEATTTDVMISHRGERFASAPWGLHGGAPGRSGTAFILRKDGTREELPSKKMIVLRPGDRLWEYIAGGAGRGDPLDRDPGRVLADVLDGKVSRESARETYGVVVTLDGGAVDEVKTKECREALRRRRGPIDWTFDRGVDGREA